jgi:DDE superfamily endonuclease/Helix-turn-helix of DDE superfamily endonuclease
MITCATLVDKPRRFLALTGLTPAEFRALLPAFGKAYDRCYPPDRTLNGQPYQRWPGGGRHGALAGPEDKLLFILVYLKAYPLQAVLGALFGFGTTQANYWLHRLLPVIRLALDRLGVLPERDGGQLARRPAAKESKQRIIDGTERRRQRPKNAEKQADCFSGKKKAHTDKNVLVVNAASKRVLFLSRTRAGKVHDKKVADEEHVRYPRGATLHKDTGFQGYEPPVRRTCQAKKKAGGARADGRGEGEESQAVEYPGPSRACDGGG